MIIKPNAHLGFNCKDLDRTIRFYEDILGCTEKFSLYYGDMIPDDPAERAGMDQGFLRKISEISSVRWIVYLEWTDGFFIELFNEVDTHIDNPYDPANYGFTHFDFVVDDIHAFHQELIDRGAGEYIDLIPRLQVDRSWTMWFHDPEGNRIEVHQYTEESMQLVGRNIPIPQ